MVLDFFSVFFVLIGIVSGIASGVFGIGGGMIIVPFMLNLNLSSHEAIAISVLQMMFASIFGSYINYKNKNLNLKDGLFVACGGLFGASFSGELVKLFSDTTLTAIFLCVSIIFFLKYFFSVKTTNSSVARSNLSKNFILFCAGAITGLFAISLGIGGGLLITPILGYFLAYDSKKAVYLSLFFVIFSSIAGSFSFFRQGFMSEQVIHAGVLIGLSSMLGVYIGIQIVKKIQIKSHRIALIIAYTTSIVLTSIALLRKLNVLN